MRAKLNGSNFTGASFNAVNFNNAYLNNTLLVGAKTMQGNEMGRRGSIFSLAQNNAKSNPPNDYNSFLAALGGTNTAAVTAVFASFGYTVGNITIASAVDPFSQNPAWVITDKQTCRIVYTWPLNLRFSRMHNLSCSYTTTLPQASAMLI